MTDRETISAYDDNIDAYVKLTKRSRPDPVLLAFIGQVKPGGFVLDLGCGPATASAVMREHGLRVDPVDASPQMVRLANETHDIGARLAGFDAIVARQLYDGVWANFSLLHARPEDFPTHLRALHRALVPGGVIHLGMKLGEGTRRDRLNRYYAYYSQDELTAHLTEAGFLVDGFALGEGPGLAGEVEPWITLTATA
jgi:trans-aconitate methyltransferase